MGVIRFVVAGVASVVALAATLPVLLVGAPFWVVGAITRLVRQVLRRVRPQVVAWPELIEFVPEIGWKNRGGQRVRVRGDRGEQTFRVTTDAEGWRGSVSIDDAEMLVFGDSFAFGHGVDDGDFFAERVAGVRTKALGVNGYNLVQELFWMERLGDRLAGKSVVWLVFYGNDLMDNLHPNVRHYRTPFVRAPGDSGEWEIVTDHVRPEPWPFDPRWGYADKMAELCCSTYHSERAYSAFDFLLGQATERCQAVGARLSVLGIPDVTLIDPAERERLRRRAGDPDTFDPGIPDRRLSESCRNRGVSFATLSGVVELHDHLAGDCHWNARGHGRVAEVLEKLHRVPAGAAPSPGDPERIPAEEPAASHDPLAEMRHG